MTVIINEPKYLPRVQGSTFRRMVWELADGRTCVIVEERDRLDTVLVEDSCGERFRIGVRMLRRRGYETVPSHLTLRRLDQPTDKGGSLMECTASVTFGGFLFEAVTIDMVTADGHSWHFKGYAGEIGTANVGHGSNFSGDFPGLDHIEGGCFFEVAAAGVGAGGAVLNFHDTHGPIGTLTGEVFPAGGFTAALGGGSWDDEEWQALKNRQKKGGGLAPDYADSAK